MDHQRITRRGWLAGLELGAAAVAVVKWGAQSPALIAAGDSASAASRSAVRIARRETRTTLDPARFVGKARLAHQVARQIPDTLDQLYCYCECDKTVGHRSLLSCYTDGHAAT